MKLNYMTTGLIYLLATALAAPAEDISSQIGRSEARSSKSGHKSESKKGKLCGESFLSQLHDSAHCVFFFIPQGSAHPENNQHFHNCCFGKGKKYNQKLKEAEAAAAKLATDLEDKLASDEKDGGSKDSS